MSTGTPGDGVWTLEAYIAYSEALRLADERFQAERDRRYAEVTAEREKALKIKETADLAALQLARDIQEYKDEKANELRAQIERERRDMATQKDIKDLTEKMELAIKPLGEYVSSQRGRQKGVGVVAAVVSGSIASLGILFTVLFVIIDKVSGG